MRLRYNVLIFMTIAIAFCRMLHWWCLVTLQCEWIIGR